MSRGFEWFWFRRSGDFGRPTSFLKESFEDELIIELHAIGRKTVLC